MFLLSVNLYKLLADCQHLRCEIQFRLCSLVIKTVFLFLPETIVVSSCFVLLLLVVPFKVQCERVE